VLRASSCINNRRENKGQISEGRLRRMWFDDDVNEWTSLEDYEEVKRIAEDRDAWRTRTCQPST